MKILHLCLCGPVTDGWNYQDNLLSKYHKRLGYDVGLITSKWIWNHKGEIELSSKSNYVNSDGVQMIRLDIKGNHGLNKKFKRYEGLYHAIEQYNPDILFIHGSQFMDIDVVVKYLNKNKHVVVYVDNHADFSNSATNFISRNILHKVVWRYKTKQISPYVKKFYGVLPARVDFLVNMYGVSKENVELLVMGADDDKVIESVQNITTKGLKNKYNINENDFLIVTGGKIDLAKTQTLLLMKAIKEMKQNNIKLLVFGSVVEELKEEFNSLIDNKKIHYAGWIKAKDSYDYFAIADLVVFPGRHSVFWEQVVGQGIPMLVKHWEGTDHINLGGNVEFLYEDTTEEIIQKIERLLIDSTNITEMKKVSKEKGLEYFSYKEISKRSIDLN